jgi:enamine deaminase RidA (YjgF/YER057c/UK114 family)
VPDEGRSRTRADAALERLGIELPAPVLPNATYVPARREGPWVYVSGQLPFDDDGDLLARGRLGDAIELSVAQACAHRCALNLLAQLRAAAADDLDHLRLVKVVVFVAATPDFDKHHLVANGASDLLVEVLGDPGSHARSAIGVASLPFGSPVEVEALAFDTVPHVPSG